MMSSDEQVWIERAREDPQAVAWLYDRYFSRLHAYVAYGVGSTQDTEDLVSEIFLRMVEAIGAFEPRHEKSFAAWLFRMAHNQISDFYRNSRRGSGSVALEDLPELAAGELLPDDVILQKEKFAYLRRLIDSLPPRQQEAITLRFFGGLRNNEIARILELSEKTVSAYLCRGLEELHRQYVEDFGEAKTTGEAPSERAR